MGRSTTRKTISKMYDACNVCEHNISAYGICKAGYENFYKRKSKKNGCTKCKQNIYLI